MGTMDKKKRHLESGEDSEENEESEEDIRCPHEVSKEYEPRPGCSWWSTDMPDHRPKSSSKCKRSDSSSSIEAKLASCSLALHRGGAHPVLHSVQNIPSPAVERSQSLLEIFCANFVSYVLRYGGLEWAPLQTNVPLHLHVFRDEIGMASILFLNAHLSEFGERLSRFDPPIFANPDNVVKFVFAFAEEIIKGNVLFMEFIAFCAMIANIAIVAHKNLKFESIPVIISAMTLVCKKLMDVFYIAGGWSSLYRTAQQYIQYIQYCPPKGP